MTLTPPKINAPKCVALAHTPIYKLNFKDLKIWMYSKEFKANTRIIIIFNLYDHKGKVVWPHIVPYIAIRECGIFTNFF